LKDHVERAGLLSPKRTAELAIELCKCLAVAHEKGVVHRDIKPDNLFLDKSGLRVLDFGIARALDSSEGAVTRTGSAVGTPAYMAPEQAMGKKDISPRTDIYAVGATMLYLLTGSYLHDVDNAQEMLVNVAWTEPKKVGPRFDRLPEALALVIDRACAFAPEDRFASAEELEVALSAIVAELPDVPLARISKRSAEFSAAPTVEAAGAKAASAKAAGAKVDVSADADVVPEAPSSGARAVTPRDAEATRPAPAAVALLPRRRALLAAVGVLLLAGATLAWWSRHQGAVPDSAQKEHAPDAQAAAAPVYPSGVGKIESTPDILPAPVGIPASASAVASQTAAAPRKGAPPATTEKPRVSAQPAAPTRATAAASAQLPTQKSLLPPKPKERDIGY
ncbi:MAG TPA: serine/threonine-protein kinase, partial [Polyangiaceae bacterium]|nr:serine/threonine-protein kinase [Polyangiaceae bacterium]